MNSSIPEMFAFVLMHFDSSFQDIYKFGIKEPASSLGIRAERVDEQLYREGMLERIYRQIEIADIIIADMSGRNANVFYEVGYAHAKNKLCILITTTADDIPFDLKHRRHIVYGNSIEILRQNMLKELAWAKDEIETIRNSRVKVNMESSYARLEKNSYQAKGFAGVKLDLINDFNQATPEIEAIYFYSTEGWRLFQNGIECGSTESDLEEYDKRHFLQSPVRRLQRNSWAQLKFEAQKVLASVFEIEGKALMDSYHVHGHTTLRLVTSEGHFDYRLILDLLFDDFPF